MKNHIDAVYFISLEDNPEPWDAFYMEASRKFPDLKLHKVSAVDTRTVEKSLAALKEYNFRVSPVGEIQRFYFSTSYGAVGCYMSHYKCWKDHLDRGYNTILVLESDALLEHVIEFLEDPKCFTEHDASAMNFIQLNYRNPVPELNERWESENPGKKLYWQVIPPYYRGQHRLYNLLDLGSRYMEMHEGTESYLVSRSGARSFINVTHKPSQLMDCRFKPNTASWPFKNVTYSKSEWDMDGGPVICVAVDKLVGYMHSTFRLIGGYYPCIGLNTEHESEILNNGPMGGLKKWMINEVMESDTWEYWKKND